MPKTNLMRGRRDETMYQNSTERVRRWRERQKSQPGTSGLTSGSEDLSYEMQPDDSVENSNSSHSYVPRNEEENVYSILECQSSDSDSDSGSDSEEVDLCLKDKLGYWAVKNGCTRDTVNGILKILIEEGHELPQTRASLLGTKQTVPVVVKAGGEYSYIGIASSLKNQIDRNFVGDIKLDINIDGIPIYKSSKTSLWPILGKMKGFPPFACCLWFGRSKPTSFSEYLFDFNKEVDYFCKNGLDMSRKIDFSLGLFICDAPARRELKSIVGHNGYHSCERCSIHGTRVSNRIVFNHHERGVIKYTDEGFLSMAYSEGENPHQKGVSPLAELQIPLISNFVLDYMHLVLLGIVKRILLFMKGSVNGTKTAKMPALALQTITNSLRDIKLPSEFTRQPRGLDDIDVWKATEFRSFLLYTGMVVLKGELSHAQYKHFLSIVVAIRMLCDMDDLKRSRYLTYASKLIEYFVWNAKEHYGSLFTVYNVHSLLHLPDDVALHKLPLDDMSAFPYENFLGKLKEMTRGSRKTVAQLMKRLDELSRYGSAIAVKNIQKVDKKKNSWFSVRNGIAHIIDVHHDSFVADIHDNANLDNLFVEFIESKKIGISFIRNGAIKRRKLLKHTEFIRKCVSMSYGEGNVIVPLLQDFKRCR